MARDRLAAMRAERLQQQQTPPTSSPALARDEYEMTTSTPSSDANDMSAFYAEITSIQDNVRTLNDDVSRIADLHARALGSLDDTAAQRNAAQLEGLVDETRVLSTQLKARIGALQQEPGTGREAQIRKQQTGLVRQKFVEAIQGYQQVEQQYRAKYKQRMERQFKVVKPDATPEEVTAVVNEGQSGQIFVQALQSSTRYGESRAAYREVQARREDIQRIEKTMGELTQLFNDVSHLVEQQDETIDTIQTTAVTVSQDAEAGLSHTEKAVVSARQARKKRWICFIIVLVILGVVGIIVGVTVPKK